MQTMSAILRDRIKKLGNKEFTLQDLLYDDGTLPDHEAFVRAATSALAKFAYGDPSEITILRTERLPNKSRINIYKVNKLKIVAPKFRKELCGAAIRKDVNNWKEVYPEMFKVPKFKGNQTVRTNHCAG